MMDLNFAEFASFPVRPDLLKGESLAGYFCRYLGNNGYVISKQLWAGLSRFYKNEWAMNRIEFIQAIVGDKALTDRRFWLESLAFPRRLDKRGLRSRIDKAYFCPYCLKENDFHFALWELPYMKACPKHKCNLLAACKICGTTLSWSKILPGWHCHCGAPIKTMQTTGASLKATILARVIANAKDIILPENFGAQFFDTTTNQYELKEIYDVLDGACHFLLTD